MTDKDFTSKLTAGVRRAKQPGSIETSVPPAPAVTTTQASTAQSSAAASSTHPEDPWKDLHPKRIWPD